MNKQDIIETIIKMNPTTTQADLEVKTTEELKIMLKGMAPKVESKSAEAPKVEQPAAAPMLTVDEINAIRQRLQPGEPPTMWQRAKNVGIGAGKVVGSAAAVVVAGAVIDRVSGGRVSGAIGKLAGHSSVAATATGTMASGG